VLKRVPVKKKVWWPGDVEASEECWLKFVRAARKYKRDPFPAMPMGGVLAAFTQFDETRVALAKATKDDDPDIGVRQAAFIGAKTDLKAALAAFKPLNAEGKPHAGMREVAEEFVKVVDVAS
jgi:hypothetical protein